jgi:hypothetical protein
VQYFHAVCPGKKTSAPFPNTPAAGSILSKIKQADLLSIGKTALQGRRTMELFTRLSRGAANRIGNA